MKMYHKIQNTFFQNFDFSHIKENRKNGCDIILNIFIVIVKGLDCGSLTPPQNGNVKDDGTLYGDSIQFVCDAGYELHGNKSAECLDTGKWSTNVPTCQRKC